MIKNLIRMKMYTLHQAHKLQQRLKEVQREIRYPDSTVDAMIHEEWEAKANDLQLEYYKALQEEAAVEEVLTEIRNQISLANAKSGINLILGDIRGFEAQHDLLHDASKKDIRESAAVVKKQVDLKSKQSESDRYFGSNSVDVPIFEKQWRDDMQVQVKAMKKKIRELEDKRQELNLSTKIELSKSAVALLAKYELD